MMMSYQTLVALVETDLVALVEMDPSAGVEMDLEQPELEQCTLLPVVCMEMLHGLPLEEPGPLAAHSPRLYVSVYTGSAATDEAHMDWERLRAPPVASSVSYQSLSLLQPLNSTLAGRRERTHEPAVALW